MKKILLIIFTLFLLYCTSDKDKFIGTYSTSPVKVPGFNKPFSESTESLIESLSWKLTIKNDDIIIKMKKLKDPLKMKYKIEGNYLLGYYKDNDLEKYCPFYFSDENTIHGMGTIFFKDK